MAVDPLIALGGYDLHWWHFAIAAVVGAAALVGGYFAWRRWVWPAVSKWSRWQQGSAAGAIVLVIAGAAYAIYQSTDRPGDVTNTDVTFEEPKVKKKKVVKTVNWPVYGYDDARTRYLPSTRVKPPYQSSDWSFQAGVLLEFSPIVVGDRLYFQDKNALLYSLRTKTGTVDWKHKIGGLAAASPAYQDGLLFAVTLEPGDVQAINPKNGKIIWEKDLPARSETSPIVSGNKVIVGDEDGTVYAFNVKDGHLVWSIHTGGSVKGGVAVHDGVAFFGNYAGELYAVRTSDGSVKWQTGTQGSSFGRTGRIYSTPAVAFGRVYVGSVDNRVYSFDEDTGELAWSQSTGYWVYSAPAVAAVPGGPPTVYIGSLDKTFYAMDARTGAIRWKHYIGGVMIGAPSVIGKVVYVGVIGPKNGTIGYDADSGRQVFKNEELGEYNPVISDGDRLYLTGTSAIRAFPPLTKADVRRHRQHKKEREARQAEKRAEKKAEKQGTTTTDDEG
jgi:outer membrane protein assembly factor BamB